MSSMTSSQREIYCWSAPLGRQTLGWRLRLWFVVIATHDPDDRPDHAPPCIDACHDRQQDHHDEQQQPVASAMADIPPDDGEQHGADEYHDVAPIPAVRRSSNA